MKTLLMVVLLTIFAKAQSTYDVGQSNAGTSQALAASLAQLDSNVIFRNELNSLSSGKQNLDADLTDLSDGELTGSKVGSGISGTNVTTGTVADARIASTITRDSEVTKELLGTNGDISDGTITNGDDNTLPTEDDVYDFVVGYAQPLEATLTDIADGTIAENLVNTANPWAENEIVSTMATDAEVTASLTAFYDTLAVSFGVMDTVTTGDYSGWKVPNNITVTEVSAYTNTGTVTFNIEERGETTPNTAGTDVMTSDLAADSDQQETGTFSNAALDRNDWLVLNVTSITGDPTIFSATIRYIKTN